MKYPNNSTWITILESGSQGCLFIFKTLRLLRHDKRRVTAEITEANFRFCFQRIAAARSPRLYSLSLLEPFLSWHRRRARAAPWIIWSNVRAESRGSFSSWISGARAQRSGLGTKAKASGRARAVGGWAEGWCVFKPLHIFFKMEWTCSTIAFLIFVW